MISTSDKPEATIPRFKSHVTFPVKITLTRILRQGKKKKEKKKIRLTASSYSGSFVQYLLVNLVT